MIGTIRKLCGYRFPRMGKHINRCFFSKCPTKVRCELFPDIYITFNLNDLTQQATFWQGERFEYPTTKILKSWGGEAFFDIGANYGFYSYFMTSYFKNMEIYSFEPNPKTFAVMKKIVDENSLNNFHAFNQGLGSSPGELYLHPGLEDSGHLTFLTHPEFVHNSHGREKITTFDQWCIDQKLVFPKRPEWMAKIDVEGMEFDVLLGMKKALEVTAFKGIVIEVLEHTLALAGHKPEDIFNFMNTVGYKPISAQSLIQKYGYMKTANVFFVPTGLTTINVPM